MYTSVPYMQDKVCYNATYLCQHATFNKIMLTFDINVNMQQKYVSMQDELCQHTT